MLAASTGVDEVSMMLTTPKLRVIHVTTHIGLIDAIRKIEPGLVERTIRRGHEALIRSGIARPRIGVCGINPHAGEHGLFGYGEEEEKIDPAVRVLGLPKAWTSGAPYPPIPCSSSPSAATSTSWSPCTTHQGHGPVKAMGIEAWRQRYGGSCRSSARLVDHGTAFDIAGTGQADERSMVVALAQPYPRYKSRYQQQFIGCSSAASSTRRGRCRQGDPAINVATP